MSSTNEASMAKQQEKQSSSLELWWDNQNSATLIRLFCSRHVRDILIIVVLVVLGIAACICWESKIVAVKQSPVSASDTTLSSPESKIVAAKQSPVSTSDTTLSASDTTDLKFIGSALALGVAILAWCYRSASQRLGVVDLFACEIGTICKVGTLIGSIERLVAAFEGDLSASQAVAAASGADGFSRFSSAENYFPVFESNSKELEILSADVVTNVTAFYTYMKVTRDYFRQLSNTHPRGIGDEWHVTLLNIIYMMFLGYESARKSINDLIEFEPTHAETVILILLTELRAYRCLLDHVHEPTRQARLALRKREYCEQVPDLYRKVTGAPENNKRWEPARTLLEQLKFQYETALKVCIKTGEPLFQDAATSPLKAA
jgi:hypothetical protein